MADINTIKNLRNNHDKSINEIATTLDINWRTAKKYADGLVLPEKNLKKKVGMMYDEDWGDIVSLWLEEDYRLPKKKRRTNKNYFEGLETIGFKGSYRTVCNFVHDWKSSHHHDLPSAGYERLEHPPAEAQLDFGTMEVEHEGSFKDVKALVLSTPFSNAGFAVALPSENQECLLTGMKEIFKQMGCVPKTIRIDNMTTAVIKPKSKFKDAKLTNEFLQFAMHYGFNVQTCNPASGHEKGSVENKVGYVRYNFFSETPKMKDFSSLNKDLEQRMVKKRKEKHYEKIRTIESLWKEEKKSCLELPDEDYPVFKEVLVRANKMNEIKLDNTLIHIHNSWRHGEVYAYLTWDKYRIITRNGEIIQEDFRPYATRKRAIDWPTILRDWKQRLSKITYSRYWKYLPGRIQSYLSVDDLRLLYQRLDRLLGLLSVHTMIELNERFYELISEEYEESLSDVNWQGYDALTQVAAKGVKV